MTHRQRQHARMARRLEGRRRSREMLADLSNFYGAMAYACERASAAMDELPRAFERISSAVRALMIRCAWNERMSQLGRARLP